MVTQPFNIKKSMSMLVQKSQDHKKAKDHKMMIRDYAWLMISKKLKIHIQVKPIRTSSSLKSMITTTSHKLKIEVKDYELKTKVKAVAKDLWKRVQLLMQGTSLTKQERECKLYDIFDKFTHIKGEILHKYYLRFTQLINDMNIYNMKVEQFQVNIKFLNSLPPKWSKFVTDVKLVKDLNTTNFDQLHAYLEQHELYANEVRILRECNQDTFAFVANQLMTPPHFNTYQSSYNNPHIQQQFSPSQYGSIHPTQHYTSTYLSQP
ncbi:hypothetical protein Tco_1241321 [Tanacetum coccineum]